MTTRKPQANDFSVYVANLGKYNEGELVGGWITLPATKSELESFLTNTVGLELDPQTAFEKGMKGERVYEEYAIHDYEYSCGLKALGLRPHEYTDLDDLNALAWLVCTFDDSQLEAISLCADMSITDSQNVLAYANLAEQIDYIPYFAYDFDGIENCPFMDNEAKLGYTIAEQNGLIQTLESLNVDFYFDYEKYGRDCALDCSLGEYGYLDCLADFPETERYDRDEIHQLIAQDMN